MTSQGFVDNELRCEEFPSNRSKDDFSGAVYRIIPACMYSVQNEILDLLQKPDLQESKVRKLEENLEGEMKTNIQSYARLKGQPIKFGATVQLEHVLSHKLLTVNPTENATYEKDSLKLLLEDFGSEKSLFRIVPAFKYQSEGDGNILFGDKIILETASRNLDRPAFVHSSGGSSGPLGFTALGVKGTKMPAKSKEETMEVNVSLDVKTCWNINMFEPYTKESCQNFNCGDYIWINHSEEQANLVAKQITSTEEPKVYFSATENSTNGLFRIEHEKILQGGQVILGEPYRLRHLSTGLYLSSKESAVAAGPTGLELLTGRIAQNIKEKEKPRELCLTDTYDDLCNWSFESVTSRAGNKLLIKEEFYKIRNSVSKFILHGGDVRQSDVDDEIHTLKIHPCLTPEHSDYSVFKISKVDDSIIWETLFLLYCKPILTNFPNDIKQLGTHSNTEEYIINTRIFKKQAALVNKCLTDLDLFCNNRLSSMMAVAQEYGIVQTSRQNILREQSFIEVLKDILSSCLVNQAELRKISIDENVGEITPRETKPLRRRNTRLTSMIARQHSFAKRSSMITSAQENELGNLREQTKIIKRIYKLLSTICVNNQENKVHAYNYFDVYMTHVGYNLGSTDCMISICKDVETLLIKLHKNIETKSTGLYANNVMAYFSWLLRKFHSDRRPQLLKFLKTVCKYKGDGLSVNQEKIHELLFENAETYKKAIIITTTRQDNKRLWISMKAQEGLGENYLLLDDCCEEKSPYEKEIDYFVSLLDLFADMCAGRNYVCNETIREWFPIKSLRYNIWNKNLHKEIRAAFCRLLLNLYIDSYPRDELIKPELCRILGDREKGIKANDKLKEAQQVNFRLINLDPAAHISLDSIRQSGDFSIEEKSKDIITDGEDEHAHPAAVVVNKKKTKWYEAFDVLKILKKNRVDAEATIADDDRYVFQAPEKTLYGIKDQVLQFLEDDMQKPEYDIFTYDTIKLVRKMHHFEMFNTTVSLDGENACALPNSPLFDDSNTDMARMARAVFNILNAQVAKEDLEHQKTIGPRKDRASVNLQKIGNFGKQAFNTLFSVFGADDNQKKTPVKQKLEVKRLNLVETVTNDTSKMSDSIIRQSVNFSNFIKSRSNQANIEDDKIDYQVLVKIETCEILLFLQHMRQDFLISNILTAFQKNKTFDQNDFLNLLPRIMSLGDISKIQTSSQAANETFKEIRREKVEAHFYPQIHDLDFLIGEEKDSVVIQLLKVFNSTSDYRLQNLLIQLIIRSFNQRSELMANIKHLHVMYLQQDTELYSWTKSLLLNFKQYTEQSEMWIKYEQKNVYMRKKNKQTFDHVLNMLDKFDTLLFRDSYITESMELMKSETNIISEDRQNMLRHLDVPKLIINLIKDGMHSLAEIYDQNSLKASPGCNLMIKLFSQCYKVLRNFVKGNSRNQKMLHPYIYIFTTYLEIDVNQIQLICAIYRDNLKLCEQVTEDFLNLFIDLIVRMGRKKRYLDIFQVVQIIHTNKDNKNDIRALPEVQRMTLKVLLNPKTKSYVLFLKKDSEIDSEFAFATEDAYESPMVEGRHIDDPFLYHAKLIKILGMSGVGYQSIYINEAKCQKIVPLSELFRLLELAHSEDQYKPLRLALLQFFYDVYLDTERHLDELPNCEGFIQYIGTIAYELEHSDQYDQNEEQDFIPYFSLWIHCFLKYYKTYIWNTTNFYDRQDNEAINEYNEAFARDIHKITNQKLEKQFYDELIELKGYINQMFNYNIEIPERIDDEDPFEMQLPCLNNRFSTPVAKSSQGFEELKNRWSEFTEKVLYDPTCKEKLDLEKEALRLLIVNIESLSDARLTTDQLLKQLISFISKGSHDSSNTSILMNIIDNLSYFISNADIRRKENRDEAIRRVQEKLNSLGISRVVLNLMCDVKTSDELFITLLQFSTHLLEDGNEQVQKEFYAYFVSVTHSEVFFQRISLLLRHEIQKIQEQQVRNTKLPIYKDPKDGVEIVITLIQLLCENHNIQLQNYVRLQTNSRVNHNLVELTVQLLAALLKLKSRRSFSLIEKCFITLTETIQGPCRENQTAIIDGTFLELAAELLSLDEREGKLCKYEALNIELRDKDAAEMFSDDQSEEVSDNELDLGEDREEDEYGNLLDPLPGWMIARLKQSCMITIISLLEGRTDNYIITRMIRAFNIAIFKENLASIYISYFELYGKKGKEYYQNEIFEHYKDDVDYDYDSENNPQDTCKNPYYLCNIETGFMIYHLMRHFQDNDDPENRDIMQSELPEFDQDSQGTNFLQKNILGKLTKFGLGFLKEGVGFMKNLAKKGMRKDDAPEGYYDPAQREEFLTEAYDFFNKNTGNVEIVFQDDQLVKQYFPLRPEAHLLDEEMKDKFHKLANRTSQKMKLEYLIKSAPEIIEELSHELELRAIINSSRIIALVANHVALWKEVSFLLTLIINFFVLTSYSQYNDDDRINDPNLFYNSSVEGTLAIFRVLGIAMVASSGLIVAFFLLKTGPVLARRGYRMNLEKVSDDDPPRTKWYNRKRTLKRVIRASYYVMSNYDVIYYSAYVILAVIGTFVHPFFFAFHLFDIVKRKQALTNVLKAITGQFQSLFWTFALFLIIEYVFALIGYYWLTDDFEGNCPSLLICFLNTFDQGFKNDGGLGGFLTAADVGEIDALRIVYDNLYNIILMIIMLNIVQGIVIDTFASLRTKAEEEKNDMDYICFICGLSEDQIQRLTNKASFLHHTLIEHSIWNYLHYLCYLLAKEETEYTGIESHVCSQYKQGLTSFFPQRRGLGFNAADEEQEDSNNASNNKALEEKLEMLRKQISDIAKRQTTNENQTEQTEREDYNP